MPKIAGAKVLVVEDEFMVALELEQALCDLGYAVLGPAASAEDALRLLERERPDAATLDVRLRDGRVTPVAERLRAAGVPFVLVTSCGEGELPEPVLREAPRLDKPCDARGLRPAIARLLDAAA